MYLRWALFAFGFESLPMLGWLAAAAAPWLIHLLSRRKHRETAWAAMEFLLAAVKRRTRRIRIETRAEIRSGWIWRMPLLRFCRMEVRERTRLPTGLD